MFDFKHTHSGSSNDPPNRYIQKIPGKCKSEKPIHITGVDKVKLECDCINCFIVKGVKVLYFTNLH